jgi:hypothetical protein
MARNKNEQEGRQEVFGSFSVYFRRDRIKVYNLIVAELVKKYPTRANVKHGYAERII